VEKPASVNLFNDTAYVDINELFLARFGYVPNVLSINQMGCKKANKWFVDTYKDFIKDSGFRAIIEHRENVLHNVFYCLFDDLIIYFEDDCIDLLYKVTPLSKVEELINSIKKFRKRKSATKPEIMLLVNIRS